MADLDPVIPPPSTLFQALVAAVRRFGRHTPGQWEDPVPGSYGYGDLLKMSLALGRLGARLTQPGEHVGVLMPNIAVTVALVIGLSAQRRVPCMLNYTAGSEGMQNACRVAGVRTIITSRAFLDKAQLTAQAEALREVEIHYLEDLRRRFGLADKLWLIGYALWFPERVVPAADPEEPAVVLFTSGTEGRPKGVVLSHRALLANVAQIQRIFPFGPKDRILNCLPIFHSFGLTAGTLLPLVSGARLVLYTSPLHYKAIPQLIREKGCNTLFSTSTFLYQYARHASPGDLKGLKYVVAGAEKLAEPVRELWRERFGIEILEGYGLTEMAPVVAVNLPDSNRPGTVGRLLPDIEARILPVEGIARGGELHLRGPNLMSGYYRPEAPSVLQPPRSAAGEGWHDTGDVAEMDADGYLRIQGRLKRFAKVAGEQVCLDLAEAIARAVSSEAQHATLAVPEAGRGEAIVLYTTDPALTREQLVAAAQRLGLPEIALPRRIILREQLPLLSTGKVDYRRLSQEEQGT
jgi:acyl-[acyl-carrier-protein]-phospholipid O-acyltransferase/long-chain-fatty-acid--[acyl-carrier-protein] ligase